MAILTTWIACASIGLAMVWILRKTFAKDKLGHLPGPKGLPLFGNTLELEKGRMRITFQKWARQYGGVYRVRLGIEDAIVVSHFKYIQHILLTDGKVFAGRACPFRQTYIDGDQSVASMQGNDPRWSLIRKLSHRYLRQFGDGMPSLEAILSTTGKYMLGQFDSCIGRPVDVMEIIKSTALRSVSVLLLGRSLEDDDLLLHMLLKYEEDFWEIVGSSVDSMLLDVFPFLIHIPLPASRQIKAFKKFQEKCWNGIKLMQSKAKEESLTQVLLRAVPGNSPIPDCKDNTISELQAAI